MDLSLIINHAQKPRQGALRTSSLPGAASVSVPDTGTETHVTLVSPGAGGCWWPGRDQQLIIIKYGCLPMIQNG